MSLRFFLLAWVLYERIVFYSNFAISITRRYRIIINDDVLSAKRSHTYDGLHFATRRDAAVPVVVWKINGIHCAILSAIHFRPLERRRVFVDFTLSIVAEIVLASRSTFNQWLVRPSCDRTGNGIEVHADAIMQTATPRALPISKGSRRIAKLRNEFLTGNLRSKKKKRSTRRNWAECYVG